MRRMQIANALPCGDSAGKERGKMALREKKITMRHGRFDIATVAAFGSAIFPFPRSLPLINEVDGGESRRHAAAARARQSDRAKYLRIRRTNPRKHEGGGGRERRGSRPFRARSFLLEKLRKSITGISTRRARYISRVLLRRWVSARRKSISRECHSEETSSAAN